MNIPIPSIHRLVVTMTVSVVLFLLPSYCAGDDSDAVAPLLADHARWQRTTKGLEQDTHVSIGKPCVVGLSVAPVPATPGDTLTLTAQMPFVLTEDFDVFSRVGVEDITMIPKSDLVWEGSYVLKAKDIVNGSLTFRTVVRTAVGTLSCSGSLTVAVATGITMSVGGPSYVKKGESGTWTVEISGGLPPFSYFFNWGDGTSGFAANITDDTTVSASHTYTTGDATYPLTVEVVGSRVNKENQVVLGEGGGLSRTYPVQVWTPITIVITGPVVIPVGVFGGWTAVVHGGVQPMGFFMKADGKAEICSGQITCTISAGFDKAERIGIRAEVSDQRGESVESELFVDVTDMDPGDFDQDNDGYTPNEGDCDDRDPERNPGATEILGNGIDDNCDGQIDEMPRTISCYRDADGDGYGDPNDKTDAESCPPGYVTDNTDCSDADRNIHPGAVDICQDGIDSDCNGQEKPCECRSPRVSCPDGGCYEAGYFCCEGGGACPSNPLACCGGGCCIGPSYCANAFLQLCCQTGTVPCPKNIACCTSVDLCHPDVAACCSPGYEPIPGSGGLCRPKTAQGQVMRAAGAHGRPFTTKDRSTLVTPFEAWDLSLFPLVK